MDAASSTAVALLLLLVVVVLHVCNLLWIYGAMLQDSAVTNAACQQALVLAAMTKLHIVMRVMRHDSPAEPNINRNVNGGNIGQPAMGMLLQGSTDRLHSEMTHVFGTWKISNSRCSIWCATRQRRTRSDRDRVAGGRAVLQLLLCCWPSGARGHLLWLLLLLELLVVVLAALLLLLPVVAVHQ